MCSNPSMEAGNPIAPAVNSFSARDVAAALGERGWLAAEQGGIGCGPALQAWLSRAAELLGPHCANHTELAGLLDPIFVYDAVASLGDPANQDVLARTGAREVIRELANRVLDGGEIDSDRFKQIIESMKESVPYRSRAMFSAHPHRFDWARRGRGTRPRNSSCRFRCESEFCVPCKINTPAHARVLQRARLRQASIPP